MLRLVLLLMLFSSFCFAEGTQIEVPCEPGVKDPEFGGCLGPDHPLAKRILQQKVSEESDHPTPATEDVVSLDPTPVVAQTSDKPSHIVETNNIVYPPEVSPKSEPPPTAPAPLLQPLRVTEYMLRDGGQRGLPTWIELHSPNTQAVSLKGYTFTWAIRKFAKWKEHTHTIGDFSIPANGAVILVSRRLMQSRQYGGIEGSRVYDLGIRKPGNILKNGWKLTDRQGVEVFSIGHAFGKGRPVLKGSWQQRKSYEIYKSEKPPIHHFYGHKTDGGSPTFHECVDPQELSPNAPSWVRRKRVGMWVTLKVN